MTKDPNHLYFLDAREEILTNLEDLRMNLIRCVDEGMIDLENEFYNELLGLIDETHIADEWNDIDEVIAKAKTLEIDVAAWLARHGRSGISYTWPKKL